MNKTKIEKHKDAKTERLKNEKTESPKTQGCTPRPAPTPGEMAAPGRPGPENFQECPAPPRPAPPRKCPEV